MLGLLICLIIIIIIVLWWYSLPGQQRQNIKREAKEEARYLAEEAEDHRESFCNNPKPYLSNYPAMWNYRTKNGRQGGNSACGKAVRNYEYPYVNR